MDASGPTIVGPPRASDRQRPIKITERTTQAVVLAPKSLTELSNIQQHRDDIARGMQHLAAHMKVLSDEEKGQENGQNGMAGEFQSLNNEQMERNADSHFKNGTKNRDKNRYDDILPYDATRVVLRDHSSNYINANYITDVLHGNPVFVAAQGPMKSTLMDFWHMILQENIRIVGMVTNLVERGQSKCVQYWPEAHETVTIGNGKLRAKLELVSEVEGPVWTYRELRVTFTASNGGQRTIHQFHFTDWPDHGVPRSPDGFIDFVRMLIYQQQQVADELGLALSKAPPVLFHCSAGIGRTGTVIGLYAALQALQHLGTAVGSLSIMDIVRRMRFCRQFMVQSLCQYQFLYQTVLQATDIYLKAALEQCTPPARPASVLLHTKKCTALSTDGSSTSHPTPLDHSEFKRQPALLPPFGGRSQPLDDLLSLICNPVFPILEALNGAVPMKDLDALVNSLVKLFGAQGLLLPLASRVAEWEVDDCEGPKMVFRRNSLASKITTACLHLYGSGYLRRTLRPLIDKMFETPNMSYEINPQLLEPGENMGENRDTLRRLAENIFASILSTLSQIPTALNLTCYGIARATHRRFPEATFTAVGGIFFLRFLCPALVSPASHGILSETLPPRVLRGLVLASKMLQAVVNSGTKFTGFREEYMQCMDKFVHATLGKGEEFIRNVANKPDVLDPQTIKQYAEFDVPLVCKPGQVRDLSVLGRHRDGTVGGGMNQVETEALLSLLRTHREKIAKMLRERNFEQTADEFDLRLDRTAGVSIPPLWVRPSNPETDGANHPRVSLSVDLEEHNASFSNISEVLEFYPDSNVPRSQVRYFSWNVLDREYAPLDYTSPTVLSSGSLGLVADPDIKREKALVVFNDFDAKAGVDRRSYMGCYTVTSGLPRNPVRRTGIKGRGALPRWGPNHHADPIITRWQRDTDGKVLTKSGSPVLEVLLQRNEDGKWQLPYGAISVGALLPAGIFLPHVVGQAMLVDPSKRGGALSTLAEVLSHGLLIYRGYVEGPLNTDNAWIETVVVNLHDETGRVLTDNCQLTHPGVTLQWTTLQEDLVICRRNAEFISALANERKAYFADKIPRVLHDILTSMERFGLQTKGIYRVSGNSARIKALHKRVFKDEALNPNQIKDVHDLTGLLKLVLREMQPPLLTFTLYDDFVTAVGKPVEEQVQALQAVLTRMPPSNLEKLNTLLRHLRQVAAVQGQNKMTITNLALVFGPTIMRSPKGLMQDMQDSALQATVAKALLEMPPEMLRKTHHRVTADSFLPELSSEPSSRVFRLLDDQIGSTSDDDRTPDLKEISPSAYCGQAAPAQSLGVPSLKPPATPQPVKGETINAQVSKAMILRDNSDADAADDDDDDDYDDDDGTAYWYVSEAERDTLRALRKQPPGSFLIYESKLQGGNYCFSVFTGDYVFTGLVLRTERGFRLEEEERCFISLRQMVSFYSKNICPPCECRLLVDAVKEATYKAEMVSAKAILRPPSMFIDMNGAEEEAEEETYDEGSYPESVSAAHETEVTEAEGFEDFPADDGANQPAEDGMISFDQEVEGYENFPSSPVHQQPVIPLQWQSHTLVELDEETRAQEELEEVQSTPTSVLQLGKACFDGTEEENAGEFEEIEQEVAAIDETATQGYFDEEGNLYNYDDNAGYYDEYGNYYYYDEEGNCYDEEGNCYPPEEEPAQAKEEETFLNPVLPSQKLSQDLVLDAEDLRLIAMPTHSKQRANLSDKLNAIETRKSGWLLKRDELKTKRPGTEGVKKKFTKRWFALQDTMLKFYKSRPSTKQTALEYFNICLQTRAVDQGSGRFIINSPRKTYVLKANSESEAHEWVRILQNACELARSSTVA